MLRWMTIAILSFTGAAACAQQPDPAQAAALFTSGKLLQAQPMYESLAKDFPNEMLYQDHLAACMTALIEHTDDSTESKKLMMRQQEVAKRAVELGDTSYVIQMMAKRDLNVPSPDQPLTPAQAMLREAEKSFSAGDFATALAKYAQAADADPKLYEAPLYAGDAAYRAHDILAANKWYTRAISVAPNRETAYRYQGDLELSLTRVGNNDFRARVLDDGARSLYLQAIVAEPYKSLSWEWIKKWAKMRNATLQAPKIDRPAAPTVDPKNPDKIVVPMESSRYLGKPQYVVQSWMTYSVFRADYLKERFKKDFPDAKEYRHTLKEESLALQMVVKTAREKNIPDQDMDESLRNLLAVSDAGMLECWILLSGADRGIVQDYEAYRNEHRQLLRDYLDRFVVHAPETKTS
jgi:tetratricopeptide (TPR) repeat protein